VHWSRRAGHGFASNPSGPRFGLPVGDFRFWRLGAHGLTCCRLDPVANDPLRTGCRLTKWANNCSVTIGSDGESFDFSPLIEVSFDGMLNRRQEAGMEELLLALVTFAASVCFLGHLAKEGMDTFAIVVSVASMPVVGYLAYERGRSQRRWVWVAAVIGPLAIPMLYFIAAISRLRRLPHRLD
jgi:hypothetical protein